MEERCIDREADTPRGRADHHEWRQRWVIAGSADANDERGVPYGFYCIFCRAERNT
jgi:hypothetical protein